MKFLRLAAYLVLTGSWIGSLMVISVFPGLQLWARAPLVLVWLAGTALGRLYLPRRWWFGSLAAGVLSVGTAFFFLLAPSSIRDWRPDQQRTPSVTFAGDTVTIENLRHATYATARDYTVRWYTETFDLNALASLDFVLEPFGGPGVAHVFLSFGFSDGRYVSISVEARKEHNEKYSPFKGLFRHYELIYLVGDERDLIGLRSNIRNNDVYVFPVKVRKEPLRSLFVSMLRRADRLGKKPEFYNTLTHACFSSIVHHVDELGGERVGWDYRVLLPGLADGLILERGAIDFEGSAEEARRRFRINDRSAFGAEGRAWSRQIRENPSRLTR